MQLIIRYRIITLGFGCTVLKWRQRKTLFLSGQKLISYYTEYIDSKPSMNMPSTQGALAIPHHCVMSITITFTRQNRYLSQQ